MPNTKPATVQTTEATPDCGKHSQTALCIKDRALPTPPVPPVAWVRERMGREKEVSEEEEETGMGRKRRKREEGDGRRGRIEKRKKEE